MSGWTLHWPSAVLLAAGLALAAAEARGQALRMDYHRNMTEGALRYRENRVYDSPLGGRPRLKEPPEYATLRIGPFYSTATFTQSAGYRYVRTSGDGVDYLYGNRRGRYLRDGSELPLISTLALRNYLLITEHLDLDLSVAATYAMYPLNTQEDEFYVDLVDEGFFGNISMAFDLTPFLTAMLFDRLTYRTDYVDARGLSDRYGGERYRYLSNEAGLSMDWRLAKDKAVTGVFSREDFMPQDSEFDDQARVTYREQLTYRQQITPEVAVGARALWAQHSYTESNRNDYNQEDYAVFFDFGKGVGDRSGLGLRLTEFTKAVLGVGYSAAYSRSAEEGQADGQATTREAESRTGQITGFGSLTTALREDTSHTFDYRRGLRTGFNSDYERFTGYGYSIDWRGDVSTLGLFTRVEEVEPSDERYGTFRDWVSGLRGTRPLTDFATLDAHLTYTVRDNRDVTVEDPELAEDYETWVAHLGTAFAITRSITFYTYYERVERISDFDDLAYTRDIFEAMFTYRHDF